MPKLRAIKKPLFVLRTQKRKPRPGVPRHYLELFRIEVSNPSQFGNCFSKGEKTLQPRLFSTSAREALSLIEEFFDRIPEFKSKGFAGMCGDSSNPVVFKAFKRFAIKRGLQAVEASTPKRDALDVRRWYLQGHLKYGFPKEWLSAPIKRLVIKF